MLLTARATVRVATAPAAVLHWLPALVGDAVVVSDRLVREPLFVSAAAHHDPFIVRSFNGRAERLTREIPNAVPQYQERLDARGLARVGGVVREGDVLAGKVLPIPSEAREKKLLVAMGAEEEDVVNVSLDYPYRDPGVVIGVHLAARWQGSCATCGEVVLTDQAGPCPVCKAPVTAIRSNPTSEGVLAQGAVEYVVRRELRVGDVLHDREGRGCTVAEVVEEDSMPTVDDLPVDVLLHSESAVIQALTEEAAMRHWRLRGVPRPQRACRFGMIELVKTTLRQEEKWLARSTGSRYHRITLMPPTGDIGCPGQRMKPGLAGALLAAGYRANLIEMLTIKSDDPKGRVSVFKALLVGKTAVGKTVERGEPEAAHRLRVALSAACFTADWPNKVGEAEPAAVRF